MSGEEVIWGGVYGRNRGSNCNNFLCSFTMVVGDFLLCVGVHINFVNV